MKTLEHWFLPEQNFDIDRIFFYLKWEYGSKRPNKLEWLKYMPDNCNIKKKIKLRDGLNITICGNIYNSKYEDSFTDIESNFNYDNIPLLKSHLQKCVRRKLDSKAIRTSYYIMKSNPSEFFRRLPIIAIEDSCIHIGICVCIWFMTVCEEIYLQDYMIHYFLGLVRYITISNFLDGDLTKVHDNIDYINTWNICESDEFNNKNRNIILSILLRKSYGGMKGDSKMLIGTVKKLINNNLYLDRMNDRIKPVRITKPLYLKEFEISAVDFHCCPNIIKSIQINHSKISENDIKKAIWIFSSSKNKRKKTDLDKSIYQEIWDIISPSYYIYAKRILSINDD